MKFGKIDYLNLLPFHVYLKSASLQNYFKKSIEVKKSTPSKLCDELRFRRIDAGVISSIEAKKYQRLNLGICAKKQVISVLVRKNTLSKQDIASRSSNMLAKILCINGEIIIGDNALRAYLQEGKEQFYDLAFEWNEKTSLPFVFGQFACVSHKKRYKKIINKFLNKKIFIPRYILNQYSQSRNIKAKDILWYLSFIYYKISSKEEKALKLFLLRARYLHLNK